MKVTIEVSKSLESRLKELQTHMKRVRETTKNESFEGFNDLTLSTLIVDLIDDCVDVWIDHYRKE